MCFLLVVHIFALLGLNSKLYLRYKLHNDLRGGLCILQQMVEAAVDCLDDPILLIHGDTQGIQSFSCTAIRADQRFSVSPREGRMASVFLTTFGTNSCVADLFFHVILPPC